MPQFTPHVGTAGRRDIGTSEGNVPDLKAGGTLDPAVMPSIALTSVTVVANLAARLALTAQPGDVAIQTDTSKTYILAVADPSVDANWKEIITPAPVLGSAATHAAEDFATAAQGGKADTAVQPAALGTAAAKNTGTTNGTVPLIGAGDKLAAALIPTVTPGVNVETISAGKTLVAGTDAEYQYINPGAAGRIITLSVAVTPTTGSRFTIKHTGTGNNALTIKSGTTEIDRVYHQVQKTFIFDGTNWVGASNGAGNILGVDDDTNRTTTLGVSAQAWDRGTAIGNTARAQGTYSVAVGMGAIADAYSGISLGYSAAAGGANGVAVGNTASAAGASTVAVGLNASASGADGTAVGNATVATQWSTAIGSHATAGDGLNNVVIGYYGAASAAANNVVALGSSTVANASDCVLLGTGASANAKAFSKVIGSYGKAYRYGEFVVSNNTSNYYGAATINTSEVRFVGQTTDATPTELFLDAASARCTVLASSTITFVCKVAARNNVDNVGAGWVIKGVIKRDASNNTAIEGVNVTDALGATTTWAATLTADDTNEALKLTVTGEAGKTIRWVANCELVEVRF